MIKEYLQQAGKSVYLLSKESGVPYSTLNDLVNGKVEIENCKISLLMQLAGALGLTMDETFALCSRERQTVETGYGIEPGIRVRNKSYFIEFEYNGELSEIELCKVNEDTKFYIDEIARWRCERYIRDRRIAEFEEAVTEPAEM